MWQVGDVVFGVGVRLSLVFGLCVVGGMLRQPSCWFLSGVVAKYVARVLYVCCQGVYTRVGGGLMYNIKVQFDVPFAMDDAVAS